MSPYLFLVFSLAGVAVLWRTWLRDHPSWTAFLNALPYRLGKTLTCGTCFTYWLSLGAVFVGDVPLPVFSLHAAIPGWVQGIIQGGSAWMALAWGALVARFLYVLLEEAVFFFVHHIREGHTH